MTTEILAFFIGILLGFGFGFYAVFDYYKMKILKQEENYLKEKQRLLEDNSLLAKALNYAPEESQNG